MTPCKRLLQILAWLAVAAWMILIFSMSGQTADKSGSASQSATEKILTQIYPNFDKLDKTEQQSLINGTETLTRKIAHLLEYMLLSALIIIALQFNDISPAKRSLTAIIISALYASTDEIHQLFVDGRAGKATDVLIDTAGASIAAGVYFLTVYIIKKYKEKKLLRK